MIAQLSAIFEKQDTEHREKRARLWGTTFAFWKNHKMNSQTPSRLEKNTPYDQDLETYGWDSAFAIYVDRANAAITSAWPNINPQAKLLIQNSADEGARHIYAELGPWQLVQGGHGKHIRMQCPIVSGYYTTPTKTFDFDHQKTAITIEINMEWVPNPAQFSFEIHRNADLDQATEIDAIKAALNQNQIAPALRRQFRRQGKPLSEHAIAQVQKIGEEWLISDGLVNYYISKQHETTEEPSPPNQVYQFGQAWSKQLQLKSKMHDAEHSATQIISIENNPVHGVDAAHLWTLLSQWFNAHLGAFNHIFSSLDLQPAPLKSDPFSWMKPMMTSYAVADAGALKDSVLGVLTLSEKKPIQGSHHISPRVIPEHHGIDAGFVISGPTFVKNMLLPSMNTLFKTAPKDAFSLSDNGLAIQNEEALVLGRFMLDSQREGSIEKGDFPAELDQCRLSANLVIALAQIGIDIGANYRIQVTEKGQQWLLSYGLANTVEHILNLNGQQIDLYLSTTLTLAKGQFKMSLVKNCVAIELIGLKYPDNQHVDVQVHYTEQIPLTLQQKGGKPIFWFDPPRQSMEISVIKNRYGITREIVEDAALSTLTLLTQSSAIVENLSQSIELVDLNEHLGVAIISEAAFAQSTAAHAEAAATNEALTGQIAARRSRGQITDLKNALAMPKWQLVASLAHLSGAVAGFETDTATLMESAALQQWDQVPGFDLFAEAAIAPFHFPNIHGFKLVSTTLAGSLHLGFKTH